MSRELVSKVTDAVLADLTAWQTRPLDPVYPVVLSNARVLLEASMLTPGVREHWPAGRCDELSLPSRRVQ